MSIRRSRIREPESLYIPGGLRPGRRVTVNGKVDYGAERFHINFQTEADDNDGDITLHFNPRQSEGVVVKNSRQGGGWENEERDEEYFPFQQGRMFSLRFEVTESDYEVYVNGVYFTSFGHRMGPESAQFIHFSDGAEYYDLAVQDRHCVPYLAVLSGGMQPGKAIRVRGACTDSDGFSVNFVQDSDGDTNCFHFNPRPNEGCVVRNSKLDGWGPEERDQDFFPFAPGTFFDAWFVATEEAYLVYVNDQLYTTYNHRCPVSDAQFLTLQGDLFILDVQFNEPVDDDFVKKIPSGLEKGDVLTFKGYFRPGGDRFAVNLMEGHDTEDDIAMHFNPRRDDGEVVMNDRRGGDWQEEEREPLPGDFQDTRPFDLKIITKRNKFKVYINDQKYCKFRARGNVEDIRGVQVAGDVYIYEVVLQRKKELPAVERIPGNLKVGDWLLVKGMPKKSRGRFEINLKTGGDPDSDIALHFNPRLEESCVVRNSRVDGDWQEEEREQPCYPFEKKETFEILISVREGDFVTFVNGERFIDYNHRLPVESISHFELEGTADFLEAEIF